MTKPRPADDREEPTEAEEREELRRAIDALMSGPIPPYTPRLPRGAAE